MTKFNLQKNNKKSENYILTTCISPDHDQNTSTVGGVAPTRCPLSIHFVIDNAGKMA